MTFDSDGSGVVLVVGSGLARYREYLLAGAAERRPLWLLDAAEPTWQRAHLVGHDVVPLLDRDRLIPDQQQLLETALRISRERPVIGVLTWDETLVMVTARIAEALGLPGLGVQGADGCRNKHRTRQALTAAGLPQPGFALVHTAEQAHSAADRIGYPLVLKPRGMGASIGVVRVDDPDALTAAFTATELAGHGGSPSYEGGVLVEEFMRGPEISVDGAVFDGSYLPFFLARKRLGPEPYFEEIGHTVSSDDPLLGDPELVRILTEAHRALGLDRGVTHTEVRFTARGPVIIEVNARLGGDFIPYLGKLATGVDPAHIAVDLAVGGVPAAAHTRSGTVGIRFQYPPHNGLVQAVRTPEPGTLPGLLAAGALAEPGTRLLLPPLGYLGRSSYVICGSPVAVGPAACDAALDSAARAAHLDLVPEADRPMASRPAKERIAAVRR